MPDVIALGEPLVELAAEDVGPLSEVERFRRGWGGDTSNFIIAAARLGASTGYVTRVGDDEFGRALLGLWASEQVDTRAVVRDPGAPTGMYLVAHDEARRHTFTYYRKGSAASRLHPDDLDADYLGAARVLHVSGISQAVSDASCQAARRAMALARQRGVTVSYDANVRPALQPSATLREQFEAGAALADVVFLSEDDQHHLGYPEQPDRTLEAVVAAGPRLAVLKQGAAGCRLLAAGGEPQAVPGFPQEAVDATAAGDAFAAAFVVEQLQGTPPPAAAVFANAVGALAVSGLGAVAPLPTRARAEALIAQYQDVRR